VFPRETVFLRNISVDAMHKGDTDDNNDNNNMTPAKNGEKS
jgi:hypothetical protein